MKAVSFELVWGWKRWMSEDAEIYALNNWKDCDNIDWSKDNGKHYFFEEEK